jgi:hypothetical protein
MSAVAEPYLQISLQICEWNYVRAGRPVQTFNREPTLSAIAKVFLIPAFSIQGSDSEPGVLLAKQRPKVPAALHEPLAEPPIVDLRWDQVDLGRNERMARLRGRAMNVPVLVRVEPDISSHSSDVRLQRGRRTGDQYGDVADGSSADMTGRICNVRL